jgi:hypothetical protein
MNTAQALVPIVAVVLDLAIAYNFLQDLYRPERRVSGGDKTIWALIIVFGSILGWAVYLFYGREA